MGSPEIAKSMLYIRLAVVAFCATFASGFSPVIASRPSKIAQSRVCMTTSDEVLEKLKTMTLLEATDLYHQMQESFGIGDKKNEPNDDETKADETDETG